VSVTLDDSDVTHLVVADEVDPQLIPPTTSRVLVVKQQWFWESIQIDACADETLYQAKVGAECVIDSEGAGGLEAFFFKLQKLLELLEIFGGESMCCITWTHALCVCLEVQTFGLNQRLNVQSLGP